MASLLKAEIGSGKDLQEIYFLNLLHKKMLFSVGMNLVIGWEFHYAVYLFLEFFRTPQHVQRIFMYK